MSDSILESKSNSLLALAGVIIAVLLVGGAYLYTKDKKSINTDTVHAAGSFYPLAHFIQRVGGSHVEVANITPAGSEPHDFEPTAQDVTRVTNSQLFVYNGSGMDAWADKIAPEVKAKGGIVLSMSERVQLLPAPGGETEGGTQKADATDPHFWLDPVIAQNMVLTIRDALIEIDPIHRPQYEENTDRYIAELKNLDASFHAGLTSCRLREGITAHAAFGYLAKRYNLSFDSISGLSPEAEPSAKQLTDLAALAKSKGIQYIFFETLVNPKLADTLAAEVGAKTLVFNPLEGLTTEQQIAGDSYISIMRQNLRNLETALDCQVAPSPS